jgi:hypothetical protein
VTEKGLRAIPKPHAIPRAKPRKKRRSIESTIPLQSTTVVAAAEAMHPARGDWRSRVVRRDRGLSARRGNHGAVTRRLSFR